MTTPKTNKTVLTPVVEYRFETIKTPELKKLVYQGWHTYEQLSRKGRDAETCLKWLCAAQLCLDQRLGKTQ